MKRSTTSERGLVLAPRGRDAVIARAMLHEVGITAEAATDLPSLVQELDQGAGFCVVTEEALATADLHPLAVWIGDQQEWSDLPFILLTTRGGGLERNPSAARYVDLLTNVAFIERPFHPTTLVSLAQAALRGRRRQYEARGQIAEVAESAARLRIALSAGRLGEWEVDLASQTLRCSPTCKTNFGREPDAPFSYGDLCACVHPDDRQRMLGAVQRSIETGADYDIEYRAVTPDGGQRWLRIAARVVRATDGRPRSMVGVSFDITAQKEAESRLLESKASLERRVVDALAERKLFADVVMSADASFQVLDQNFRFLAINPHAVADYRNFFGVEPKVGQTMQEVLAHAPEQVEPALAVWRRALAGESFDETRWWSAPDLPARAYQMHFRPLNGPEGRASAAYLFGQDVTERLRGEERLAEATAQLHEAQKLETIGQLTGGVAHDFNNLLTPIIGALDLVRRKYGDDHRTARLVDGALQSGERAKILVQRLLGFARRQTLETRPVNLAELADGMVDLIRSSVGPSVELRVTVDDGLPPALVDPNQLELAILNLCVNARDAMPDGGRLTIVVERETVGPGGSLGLSPAAYVRLSVLDTGKGMDETTLRRAVEPFYSTKGVGKGTGLGLSMVHGLAAQLGGAFALASKEGEGTRADLYLPIASPGAVLAETRPSTEPVLYPGRSLDILLVDDEPLVRAGTAEMLRELGHEVIEAGGGSDALRQLDGGLRVDAVVSDYMMPQMNGAELARRLRDRNVGAPVLVITGYAGGDLDIGLPMLAKPFRQADLAAALRKLADPTSNVVALASTRRGNA